MNKINTKGLILTIFISAVVLSLSYLVLGHFCSIPHILLLCILGTFTLVPIELGIILKAGKQEYGKYSLQTGQEKISIWKVLIIAFVFFGIAGLLSGPITEELFFRGYLTSHYEKQKPFTPILIAILFSLYHFWLPFNNVFRILAFAPVAYIAYKKKNLYISLYFHCFCNLFATSEFILMIL